MATVIVHRRTVYNKRGVAQLVATPEKVVGVTARLIGNKVRTTSGDVWKVKPYDGQKADFIVDEPVG